MANSTSAVSDLVELMKQRESLEALEGSSSSIAALRTAFDAVINDSCRYVSSDIVVD